MQIYIVWILNNHRPKSNMDWKGGINAHKNYCKNLETLDTWKIAVIILKFEQCGFTMQYSVKKMQMKWQRVQTLIRLLLQKQPGSLN